MLHTSTLYLIRPMVELAERIAALSGIPDAKVFFTTSGTEANEAALLLALDRPAVQPGAGPAQQLPRPFVRHDGRHRQPGLVGVEPDAVHGQLRRTPATASAARGVDLDRPTPSPACARRPPRRHRRPPPRGDVACLIAEPIQGVGGFAIPPDGLLRRHAEGARRVRDPVRQRRGADRLGPHRRPLLGLPGARRRARPADLRQGPRQRAGDRRRRRARPTS